MAVAVCGRAGSKAAARAAGGQGKGRGGCDGLWQLGGEEELGGGQELGGSGEGSS